MTDGLHFDQPSLLQEEKLLHGVEAAGTILIACFHAIEIDAGADTCCIPCYVVSVRRLNSVDQRAYDAPENIVDNDLHGSSPRNIIADGRCGVEGIRIIL